jgi:transposase
MAMGKRKAAEELLFVAHQDLPRSAGHPFYVKLNQLLDEAGFDRWLEKRCAGYYAQEEKRGQPSIPPGVYFRMLFVGYFEGIDSQRGIAWRCADSLSLRQFLGMPIHGKSPDHSTLTNTRKRLGEELFTEVFQFVLGIAVVKDLIAGKTVGVDSTFLEANAAMKSIVRRDSGADWKAYVTGLMRAEGVIEATEEPSAEEVRRYDKKRKNKKVSNEDWVCPNDTESRIAQMKDGRTHLAYKAEHVVDLKSDMVLAAEVVSADLGDTQSMVDSVLQAQTNLQQAGSAQAIEEIAADKGYHGVATMEFCEELDWRTYIPEPQRPHRARWTDKPEELRRASYNNRRRIRRTKSKRLQRRRSEVCERTFAHICDSGGMRRTWLGKLVNVRKRYVLAAAAHNLGRILRKLFGVGKPKSLQGEGGGHAVILLLILWLNKWVSRRNWSTQRRTAFFLIK